MAANFQSLAKQESSRGSASVAAPSVNTSAPQVPVIAIGGIGSKPNDPFFSAVKQVAPGASTIPIGNLSTKNATDAIRNQILSFSTNNRPVLVVGHSLGGVLANRLANEGVGSNGLARFIYADPPYNVPFQNAPGAGMIPIVNAIRSAADSGIQYNPKTINWTQGTAKPAAAHSPWSHTNSLGSAGRLNEFSNVLSRAVKPWPLPTGPN